ncbi:peptidase M75 family protein [Nocardioides marmoriginsengisoli]|uniref:Peptidase M75 family protein n=1 Tax=Nocardioides marmoriginsengisoli TaxID=661483 RepID=A0A3N0CDC9_9ACTN|nr:iron uptake system protein EfeO [Nocardioides marmoriginsengisoli]RNL61056.1 peptidase M75 family protein [Nocardioides marmoriginsengisoli]
MKLPILLSACALAVAPLSACSLTEDNDSGKNSSNKITVTSTDDKCEVSAAKAESGRISFNVKNDGSKVTEFYLYGEDGLRIVGEVENIGPGITRDLVLTAQPGTYFTACKPGMIGKGIRADFTVSDSGKDVTIKGVDQKTIDTALAQYSSYVKDQTSQLVADTQEFIDAYKAGDDDKARTLFPTARTHWEGTETVAESFGDLDPKTDLREADLEPGQKWTGWHAIEKDLWPPAKGYTAFTPAQRVTYADDLMANITTLNTRVQTLTYTVDQIANGSKGLLDEVATGKISGEEDIWSHTDLWDFQANVDGAKVGYETLKPLLDVKDKALSETLATRFAELQKLLDKYKVGDGFVFYDTVKEPQRQELSDAVNALSEPLSKMAGALTL